MDLESQQNSKFAKKKCFPKTHCTFHEGQPIKYICIKPICLLRLYCDSCLNPDQNHKHEFISIKEFLTKYSKIPEQNNQDQLPKLKESVLKNIRESKESILREFNYLEKKVKAIFMSIHEQRQLFEETLSELQKSLNQISQLTYQQLKKPLLLFQSLEGLKKQYNLDPRNYFGNYNKNLSNLKSKITELQQNLNVNMQNPSYADSFSSVATMIHYQNLPIDAKIFFLRKDFDQNWYKAYPQIIDSNLPVYFLPYKNRISIKSGLKTLLSNYSPDYRQKTLSIPKLSLYFCASEQQIQVYRQNQSSLKKIKAISPCKYYFEDIKSYCIIPNENLIISLIDYKLVGINFINGKELFHFSLNENYSDVIYLEEQQKILLKGVVDMQFLKVIYPLQIVELKKLYVNGIIQTNFTFSSDQSSLIFGNNLEICVINTIDYSKTVLYRAQSVEQLFNSSENRLFYQRQLGDNQIYELEKA